MSVSASESRALPSFAAKSATLSNSQRTAISNFIKNKEVETITCTGHYASSAAKDLKNLALKRAQIACNYATEILTGVNSVTKVSTTKSKTLSSTVTITYTLAKPKQVEPFSAPFPTTFTKQDVINAALANLSKYKREIDSKSSVNIVLESTFPKSEVLWITKMVNVVNQTLPFPERYSSLAAFGSTDEFLTAEIIKAGHSFPSGGLCNRKTT